MGPTEEKGGEKLRPVENPSELGCAADARPTAAQLPEKVENLTRVEVASGLKSERTVLRLLTTELSRRAGAKPWVAAALRSGGIRPEITLKYYPVWVKSRVKMGDFTAEWQSDDPGAPADRLRGTQSYVYRDEEADLAVGGCPVLRLRLNYETLATEEAGEREIACEGSVGQVSELVKRAIGSASAKLLQRAEAFAKENLRGPGSESPLYVKPSAVEWTEQSAVLGLVPVYSARFAYCGREYTSFFSGVSDDLWLDFPGLD